MFDCEPPDEDPPEQAASTSAKPKQSAVTATRAAERTTAVAAAARATVRAGASRGRAGAALSACGIDLIAECERRVSRGRGEVCARRRIQNRTRRADDQAFAAARSAVLHGLRDIATLR